MKDLLVPVLVVEASLLAVCVVVVLGHMGATALRRRVLAPRLARAERDGAAAIARGQPRAAAAAFARLPVREQVRLLAELGEQVTERGTRTVTAIARRSGLLARTERRTTSLSRWRRLRALRVLTHVGGGRDVVPARLEDPAPEVRAQAAAWVARHGDARTATALAGRLTDGARLARFAAADAVVRIGRAAAPDVARRLDTASGPTVLPILAVAAALGEAEELRVPAQRHLAAPEPEVRAAAVAALARLGGADDAIADRLDDPDAGVRAAAAEGCGALGAWRHAPRLGTLLRDPSWDVRRAAGQALRALGGPGALVLRRALDDHDPFAADMARLALEEERLA